MPVGREMGSVGAWFPAGAALMLVCGALGAGAGAAAAQSEPQASPQPAPGEPTAPAEQPAPTEPTLPGTQPAPSEPAAPGKQPAPSEQDAPAAPEPAMQQDAGEPDSDGFSPLTYVGLIVGAAAIGAGVGMGVAAKSNYDAYLAAEIETPQDAKDARERYEQANSLGSGANMLVPAGSVMMAAGLASLIVEIVRRRRARAAQVDPEQDTNVALTPLPSGAALLLEGRL